MLNNLLKILRLGILLSLVGCSATKYLTEDEYLLNELKIKIKIDSDDVAKSQLFPYIRQTPNEPKLLANIYNMSDGDTSKWIKRFFRKIGEAPVIYNENLTKQSVTEMEKELFNSGYFNSKVTYVTDTIGKEIEITYTAQPSDPYKIRNYKNEHRIDSILEGSSRTTPLVMEGEILKMSNLEAERNYTARRLQNKGYFDLGDGGLYFLVDSSLLSNQADVVLALRDSVTPRPYVLRNVTVYSGYNPLEPAAFIAKDSVSMEGIKIIYDSSKYLRKNVIRDNIILRRGNLYSERNTRLTYTFMRTLPSVSRTIIDYTQVKDSLAKDTAFLDADVYITRGNIHGIQTGIEGTNNAGDLGISGNISYNHYNIFNGSETFSIALRGSYEFITGSNDILSNNFYEYGINTSFTFPQAVIPILGPNYNNRFNIFAQYSLGLNVQMRPEFIRNFFNLNWRYRIENQRKTSQQTWSIININYIFMPYISDIFQYYLDMAVNSLARFSYENIFTAGIGYNILFTGKSRKNDPAEYSIRFGFESSGNLLYGISRLTDAKKNDNGQYTVLGNPFAQYVKGEVDLARVITLDRKHKLGLYFGGGVAFPYSNSSIMPFEKRYFMGGPNGVRGWNTRQLGPGRLSSTGVSNIATHVGDIRLMTSVEYRYKWFKYIEFATFYDAGNIWTIRNYENQPGGLFSSLFFKEIAMGTGVGIRFDLSFLIIRFDLGKKVYDPSRLGTGKSPWVLTNAFRNNTALYFAIGYPF